MHDVCYSMTMQFLIISMLFLTSCATLGPANSEPKIPKVFFSYSFLFDQVCEKMTGQTIPMAVKTEGPMRIEEFKSQWKIDSPAFFQVLTNKIGRGFVRAEETVSLTSCNIPSVSDPILIPMKRWFASLGGKEPMYGFSDVIFHELLHRYLTSNFDADKSVLIKKYKAERQQVLSHLHSMALQKMIYSDLKRTDLLKWLDRDYNELIGGDYRRAWEIVNSIEGYDVFVSELPTMLK